MKQLFLFIAIAFLFVQCTPRIYHIPSSPKYQDKYADQLEPGAVLLKSWYHFTVEKFPTGEYVQKIFYPDTKTLTHFVTYKDEKLTIKNGPYKEFWDDGEPASEGVYMNDNRVGEWTNYTGKFASKGKYINGVRSGLWITRDSAGNKTATYNYLNDKLHGNFKKWSSDGTLVREGNYIEGKIDWEKSYSDKMEDNDNTMPEELFKRVDVQPFFKSPNCDNLPPENRKQCSDTEMLKFVYSNIKYPSKARELGIEGMVIVQFVVEKDGSISNVRSRRGICKEMKDECLRIVNSMPAWSPGYQKGKPVRVQFNLPVKFKLE